jgi:flagellar protein FlaF
MSISRYRNASNLGGASPVETEILALGLCNDKLSKVQDPRSRVDALARNHALWAMFLRDLGSDHNQLPKAIKDSLVQLSLWSMAYSNLALTKALSLQPLIEVNRNIQEGLRQQAARSLAS